MAIPTVTVTPDKTLPYAPGEPITLSWTVVDSDNSTETIHFDGTDSQGNIVSGTVVINREDTFTMDQVRWIRTGVDFSVNNGTRTATSTVPAA